VFLDAEAVRPPVLDAELWLRPEDWEDAREEAVLLVAEPFWDAVFPEELLRVDAFAVLFFFFAVDDFVAIQFLFCW